jgi:hypothetical protein
MAFYQMAAEAYQSGTEAMAYFGLGAHVIVALFFAVHAIRAGRELYWLAILFMFPLLGSIVYFFAVFLPETRIEQNMRKAGSKLTKILDPTRELREAKELFELTPTTQNQTRLASALLETGNAAGAAAHYEAALKGQFSDDADLKFGAARARAEIGQFREAAVLLREIREHTPTYRREETTLLMAKLLGASGQTDAATTEYKKAIADHNTVTACAEYAIFALGQGDVSTATQLQEHITVVTKRWNKHNRAINADVIKRLKSAWATAAK